MDFNSTDPQFLASGFAGYATFRPSPTGPIPVIHINFAMLSAMPVPAQKFLFWHECGHHQNPLDPSPAKEVNANCWAMGFIRQNRILTAADEQVLAQFLSTLPPIPPLYPAGVVQWQLMNTGACGTPPSPTGNVVQAAGTSGMPGTSVAPASTTSAPSDARWRYCRRKPPTGVWGKAPGSFLDEAACDKERNEKEEAGYDVTDCVDVENDTLTCPSNG
ncbi:hypothetical protein [Pyxidicoccus sp. MSG2]|uniref:hypothetical protein n=1 Tax=Pyxidicoccus sp. MSG2 TaxID=2996790 RepID=UPI00226DFF58|nr:hypothetical protein [Pyxidicoccus sp. MSG2]MCY1019590.1 hypothetical protein [Pyxidicoccus sp. MSG2]